MGYEVKIGRWVNHYGENRDQADKFKDAFKDATEKALLPVVKKNVFVWDQNGKSGHWILESERWDGSFDQKGNRRLVILIWSTASAAEDVLDAPPYIWGIPVDCRSWVFGPSGEGHIIYDGSYAVAELIGNNLFIHHDIFHCGTENELKIYRRILEEVVKILPKIDEEKKTREEEAKGERLEKMRKRYSNLCSFRLTKTLEKLREKIEINKSDIEKFQTGIVKAIRELEENESYAEALDSGKEKALKKFSDEFDKLMSLPKVRDIQINPPSTIDVYTDVLYCVDPRSGRNHQIGEFRIVIYTDGTNGSIRWHNLTRQIHDRQAPHVHSNGVACMGNMVEVIPELIANHEYSVVVMLAIQFVESVNVSDRWGKDIDDWPIVADKSQ